MKLFLLLIIGVMLSLLVPTGCAEQLKGIVNVSVADQRADQSFQLVNYGEDQMENTQLLYMEAVNIIQREGEWSYTEAIAQKIYVNDTWQPYGGWMLTSQLTIVSEFPNYSLVVTVVFVSEENWAPIFARACNLFGCLPADIFLKVSLGTYLASPQSAPANGWWPVELHTGEIGWISASFVLPLSLWKKSSTSAQRSQVVSIAQKLLGQIYFWGGRSAFSEDLWNSGSQLTGVDCSGLVSISYKIIGKLLPRNANEIFLASTNVTTGPTGLKAGDVLFLASSQTPTHMYHVMMVLDENFLAESNYDSAPSSLAPTSSLPHQFNPVPNNGTRMVSYVDKFGLPLSELRFGQQVPYADSYVYWGSYF